MKSYILLELARHWEQDAIEPETQDGSEQAKIRNAVAKGERQAKRECAEALQMLVSLLGDESRSLFPVTRCRENLKDSD